MNSPVIHQRIEFEGTAGKLWGDFWRPPGDQPMPTLIWNHGSVGRSRGLRWGHSRRQTALDSWLAMGFAVFEPSRRGYDGAGGESLDGAIRGCAPDSPLYYQAMIRRLNSELSDVFSSVDRILEEQLVDQTKLVCSGYSLGGILTLLALGRGSCFAAGVAFAAGAIMWSDSPAVRDLLLAAASQLGKPLMFVQAENDYDIGPTQVLARVLEARGMPHVAAIYPPCGRRPADGHVFFAMAPTVWARDVQGFLRSAKIVS